MKNKDSNLQEENFDKDAVRFLIENDLKSKYAKLLEKEHKIERKPKVRFLSFPNLLKYAAVFFLLMGSFVIGNHILRPDASQMAMAFAKETKILGNQDIMRKDVVLIDQIKLEANAAFVNEKYDEAILAFEKLKSLNMATDVDIFYLSVSYLKSVSPSPNKALEGFKQIESNQSLQHEILWFQALAYIMSGNDVIAKKQLSEIIINEKYKSSEARKLLDAMK
jgi:hypothetical protein